MRVGRRFWQAAFAACWDLRVADFGAIRPLTLGVARCLSAASGGWVG